MRAGLSQTPVPADLRGRRARGSLHTRCLPSLLLAFLVALVCAGAPSVAPCRVYAADLGELVEVWITDANGDDLSGEVDINVLQQGIYVHSAYTNGGVTQSVTVYDNDTGNRVSTEMHSLGLEVTLYTFEELLVVGHSYTIDFFWYQYDYAAGDLGRSTGSHVYFTFTVGGSSGGDDEDDGGGAAEGSQDDQDDGGGASDGSQDDGGQGGSQDVPDPDPAPVEEDAEAGGSQYQDDGGQGGAQDAPDPDPAPAEDGDGRGDLDDAVVSGALGGVGDATGGAGGSSGGGSSGRGDAGAAMGNSNEEASAEADSDAHGASSSPSGGLAPERPTIGRRAESAVRASDPASEPSRASVASSVIGDVVSGSDMEEFRGRGDDLYELAVGAGASPEAASAGGSAGGSAGTGGAGGSAGAGGGSAGASTGVSGSDRDASPMSPAGLSEEASGASGDEEPASPGDVYTVGAPAQADFTVTGLSYVWAAVWALVAAAAALGVLRRPVAARLGRTRRSRLSGAPAALWSQPGSEGRRPAGAAAGQGVTP